MSLPIPPLDDLDFEALMAQARSFIPRYAPAWTDHNLHDPGITLLELAAWLVDQQLYRVGFVSDRHLHAFAALLGVKPEQATAAEGLIWPDGNPFPESPEAGKASAGANLVKGTRLTCLDQPDIPFELAATIYLSPACRPHSTTPYIPLITPALTQVNASGVLEVVFDRPLVIAPTDTTFPVSIGIDLVDNDTSKRLNQSPGGHLLVDYRTTTDAAWERLPVVQDTTCALNQTGILLLSIPSRPATNSAYLRIHPTGHTNPLPPRIKRLELNVLPIIQTSTIPQAILGVSNGLPDQTFPLNIAGLVNSQRASTDKCHAPLCLDILGDDAVWKETQDLSLTGQEPVFWLDHAHNLICFGNGVNGKIPPNGSQIRHSSHKLTQGQIGNLQAGLGWSVAGLPLPHRQSRYGSNRSPLYGGSDVWSMERLIADTRKAALERTALLSNDELIATTTALTGMAVDRASVLVGFHPAFPQHPVKNARALVVIPQQVQTGNNTATPDQNYFRNLHNLLKPRQVLGERLSVLPARVVQLHIEAEILCADGMNTEQAIKEAGKRLQARFTAVTIPNPWHIQPWSIGRDVKQTEVKALLIQTTGVIAITRCVITRTDTHTHAQDSEQKLVLHRDQVAVVVDKGFNITLGTLPLGGA